MKKTKTTKVVNKPKVTKSKAKRKALQSAVPVRTDCPKCRRADCCYMKTR